MSTTPAQLLQFCRDYECETLSELLLSVAESSKHCTSEGGGRIPTWPLKEAARRLDELERENAALQKERDYAVKWGNQSLDSVKAVMWRYEDALKQISGTSSKLCPFTRGVPNNLQPDDPCPVCGDKGDFSDETTSSPSRCVGNPPSAIARAALAGSGEK